MTVGGPPTSILVLHPQLSDEQRRRIVDVAEDVSVVFAEPGDDVGDRLAEATIVAGRLDDERLARCDRLLWLHDWAAGPPVGPANRAHQATMTSSKGNGAVPLAEHAMLLMLALDRDLPRWLDAQRDRRWERRVHGELAGRTLGLIGLGNAGRDLARKASAFHMRVLGVRRTTTAVPAHVDEVFGPKQLTPMLRQSDVVVVTAPLTEETRGMLGHAEFRAMKPTATYICVSRGGIADDEALLAALREAKIAGAGLDAHTLEPLPPDSPFWHLPNVLVTPHNGATTRETGERGVDIFIENLRRFLAGRPLTNVVDLKAGY